MGSKEPAQGVGLVEPTHCLELFESLGHVALRPMFGGNGFFSQGAMFALVHCQKLYLRVDEATRVRHEERGLRPFIYVTTDGLGMQMPYYEAPPEALTTASAMNEWALPALRAAREAARTKKQQRDSGAGDGTRRRADGSAKASDAPNRRKGRTSPSVPPQSASRIAVADAQEIATSSTGSEKRRR